MISDIYTRARETLDIARERMAEVCAEEGFDRFQTSLVMRVLDYELVRLVQAEGSPDVDEWIAELWAQCDTERNCRSPSEHGDRETFTTTEAE